MDDLVTEFAKVLDTERDLALKADVDALGAIQEQKRLLLAKLLTSGAPPAESEKLKQKALANVQLIRHLVACLQGLSSAPSDATYTAGGGRPSGSLSRSWGRL